MPSFDQIRNSHQKDWPLEKRFTGQLLALDPGETTGYCLVNASHDTIHITHQDQIKTWINGKPAIEGLQRLINAPALKHIVYERYGVYSWKTDQHSWSDVPTLQVIGCIKTLAMLNGNIPYHEQTAQIAKQFVTDDKLQAWGYDPKGKRHARDATRHALYYLLFGKTAQ